MFATILPGLRELRVPLAAGFIWLAALAVAFSGFLPGADTDIEFFQQIYVLGGLLGGTVLLSAVTFVAYLIGIILAPLRLARFWNRKNTTLSPTIVNNLNLRVGRDLKNAQTRNVDLQRLLSDFPLLKEYEQKRMDAEERNDQYTFYLSYTMDSKRMLMEQWEEENTWAWLHDNHDPITSQIVEEANLAEISLQANNKDIYDKFDRDKAEGEFRFAIVVPLAALAVALTYRTFDFWGFYSFFCLVILVACFFLNRSAQDRQIEANDAIILAILAYTCQSPTLKLIEDAPAKPKKVRGPNFVNGLGSINDG